MSSPSGSTLSMPTSSTPRRPSAAHEHVGRLHRPRIADSAAQVLERDLTALEVRHDAGPAAAATRPKRGPRGKREERRRVAVAADMCPISLVAFAGGFRRLRRQRPPAGPPSRGRACRACRRSHSGPLSAGRRAAEVELSTSAARRARARSPPRPRQERQARPRVRAPRGAPDQVHLHAGVVRPGQQRARDTLVEVAGRDWCGRQRPGPARRAEARRRPARSQPDRRPRARRGREGTALTGELDLVPARVPAPARRGGACRSGAGRRRGRGGGSTRAWRRAAAGRARRTVPSACRARRVHPPRPGDRGWLRACPSQSRRRRSAISEPQEPDHEDPPLQRAPRRWRPPLRGACGHRFPASEAASSLAAMANGGGVAGNWYPQRRRQHNASGRNRSSSSSTSTRCSSPTQGARNAIISELGNGHGCEAR